MYTILIVLTIIVCILLVLIVLIQNPKGGLSSQFMGAGTQLMGVKKTTDLLEKITWGLAIALLVFSVGANALISGSNETTQTSSVVEKAQELPAVDLPKPANLPSTTPGQTPPNQGQPATPPA